ncbi:hypothetical protein SAMN04488591_0376 [Microbacterium azadirachtae]|uniref:ABC-2 type transport system permease protein n=1 Tax=Microbacterium azadirachtae TaxID=582680 RepID=A0A1I6FVC4_9MICO|nr:hypothetical protein SAMN04488591_0376 [Microbacterium azadirachtae]
MIWRARDAGEREGLGYLIYVVAIVAFAVVVPLLMLLWSWLVTPVVTSALLSDAASKAAMIVCVLLWAAGCFIGRLRGPAVRPPFLTFAFSIAPLRRRLAFGMPVAYALGFVVAFLAFAGGMLGAAMWSTGHVELASGAAFVVASVGVGLLAGSTWLLGQIFPRSSLAAGVLLVGLGVTSTVFGPVVPYLPWHWVSNAYPVEGSFVSAFGLLLLAVGVMAFAVARMERLRRDDLLAQAQLWDTAHVFASTFDLESASAVYRARPRRFRAVSAVRSFSSQWLRFVARDALGAARTPLRATMGAVLLAGAGAIVGLGPAPTPTWGAVAGLLAYVGVGPLSDGLRHAVAMSADLPLYGVSDRALVSYHTVFPAVGTAIFLGLGSVIASLWGSGRSSWHLIATTAVLVLLTIAVRVCASVKGPMPVSLLAPASTPMGDLGAIIRLLWLFDAVLLAALAGAFAATGAWYSACAELALVVLLVMRRWSKRRHG